MKILISGTLKGFFERHNEINLSGKNLRELLETLTSEYPDAKKVVFGENGTLRDFIKVYVNEKDFSSSENWEKPLSENDEILLLPAIAGGSPDSPEEKDCHATLAKTEGANATFLKMDDFKITESLISDERRKEILLDEKEVERFNKHLMLREISVKGQKRIKAAKVTVIGAGALGSSVIQYLAAAGIGNIKIVDFDEVTLGNLQSQVIHTQRDLARPKVASAKDKVRNINRNINVEDINIKIDAENISEIVEGSDVVLDCTDNYKSRYLINDATALLGIPLVYGAIYQYEGQVSVFNLNGGPCLRCQYLAPPPAGLVPTCAEGGTISSLAGIIGSIQANEALKLIIGIGETLRGRLLAIDTLNIHSKIVPVYKNEKCPICGKNHTLTEVEDFDYEDFCGLKQEEDEETVEGIEAEELVRRLSSGEPITIIDVREPHERAIHKFKNAIAIPIGQLTRRQKELNPDIDTVFICKEGKRSILAIKTLREAGYKGPMYNLKGGFDAANKIIFPDEGAWL